MVGKTIDDLLERMPSDHVRIMDEDTPEIDSHKETKVKVTLHGENENEKMVRDRLSVPIYRVESVRSKRGRH